MSLSRSHRRVCSTLLDNLVCTARVSLRTRRLCWSTEKCTCRVYCRRSRHDGAATRSRKGVGVYSTLSHSPRTLHQSVPCSQQQQQQQSWRSDTLIILPGWECHTGGSRSKPTVHRCSQSGRRLWVARQIHNHEPNGSATMQQETVHQCQHSSSLRFDAGRHLFSEGKKNVALSCSLNLNTLLASVHAASRAPCSCHSVSS